MKLLILADIDELHWTGGKGNADLLPSCGDVPDRVILEAAKAYACTTVFAVNGNHDSSDSFAEPILDLHLRLRDYGGIRFGGLNGAWRYKPRGHFLYEQEEVDAMLATFPPVDIFISHNSPRGIHDREDEVHYGFEGLATYIRKAKPAYLIHGHQHVNRETQVGTTKVIGVYGHRSPEI